MSARPDLGRIVPVGTLYDHEEWMRCIAYEVHAETDLGGRTDLELMRLLPAPRRVALTI